MGPRRLLVYCSDTPQDRRVHTGKPLVEARHNSVGDNQGKLPSSQHHTGSAEQPERDSPLCRFIILSLRFVSWG